MSKASKISEKDRERIAKALGHDRNTGGMLLSKHMVIPSRRDKAKDPRKQRKTRSWQSDFA
jgi:hypothetical protein